MAAKRKRLLKKGNYTFFEFRDFFGLGEMTQTHKKHLTTTSYFFQQF
jgi:hypothetical protein